MKQSANKRRGVTDVPQKRNVRYHYVPATLIWFCDQSLHTFHTSDRPTILSFLFRKSILLNYMIVYFFSSLVYPSYGIGLKKYAG